MQQQNVGMDGPLVDIEGFPRGDIDVYSVRHGPLVDAEGFPSGDIDVEGFPCIDIDVYSVFFSNKVLGWMAL